MDYADYYQGLWDCHGDQPDELSFQRGDLIRILSKVRAQSPGLGSKLIGVFFIIIILDDVVAISRMIPLHMHLSYLLPDSLTPPINPHSFIFVR